MTDQWTKARLVAARHAAGMVNTFEDVEAFWEHPVSRQDWLNVVDATLSALRENGWILTKVEDKDA
jgi:hypothetical protein